MTLSAQEVAQLRAALQDAVVKCSERCLYQSSKWAAELLNALPESDDADHDIQGSEDKHTSPLFTPNPDQDEAALEARELSKYLLAKSLFDCKEYDRCAAVFLPESLLSSVLASHSDSSASSSQKAKGKAKATTSARSPGAPSLPNISQKSLFLALYAKFMAGEKRKNEESEMVMGPQDLGTVVNKQLLAVGRYLAAWFDERTADDEEVLGSQGWLEYLYGMVLAKEKNDSRALEFLIRSVHKYPMNWGCWLEMTSLVSRVEELNRISRHCPQNIVSFMFHLHTSLELYQQSPSLANNLEQLLSIFPTSPFLLTCHALLAYHAKDLMAAEQHFSRLLSLHPHRLDSLDHYSNILYVLNLRPKLAFVAHLCSSVDKFRPESCVVIGNYYSLLSLHEKAVQYFRRALTLDRSCLSAWTLMGHEYVELKNTHAAIESYRRAVDVNRRDYRAWYGLGQTYEMLEMHTYSLWYYKKAAGLRPWDGKMWLAVGSCLQKMGRERDGIKALKRALLADAYYEVGSSFGSGGDPLGTRGATGHMDPEILLQIATMFDELDEEDEAKAYMELCVAQEDGGAAADASLNESVMIHNDSPAGSDDDPDRQDNPGATEGTGVTAATSKARMWLAKFAMRTADYATANRLATELCQDGVEVEEAKALVREIRSILDPAGGVYGSAS
ncbi:anaphase promoting complex subunit [Hirsutella rhossiliensis]|uniref:Anaphase promoting complex subunit 8 / cdc23 domain-containing protein n=1 Tax=Hirsutella rhossiliensis TaxID=111463 RepID=A0A9P8N5S5_9HYPO|nr:anaphase promoting complex subunit 8 / cdc23 domain-containing protein [Hirsutella rhossiliensis]KAH0965157.1 anaphase promoting complex subunit 8 / cdc23 domain-containing protein [Hirsutella rhossiliensis]